MTRGFSATPRWVVLPAAAGALLILLPLVGMLLRIDWAHLGELLTSESSLAALWLSLRTAVASTALCLVLGAEGPGLREKTLETCDRVVRIPFAADFGSLNVSNAAAITLYALGRTET